MGDGLLIDPSELAARLGEPGLRVLDATVHLRREHPRGPYTVQSAREDYERGHIPGSVYADVAGALSDPAAPHPLVVPDAERFARAAGELGVSADSHVVTYSQHSPMWATRLWWLLRYFGMDRVSVLNGGLQAWAGAGLELADGTESYPPASFEPGVRPQMLARLRDVQAVVGGSRDAVLANALAPEAFRGEGPGAYSRPGRIPGSINVHWEQTVDPATGRFLSPAELEGRLGDLGAPGTEPVIAYCGGGISATVDLFALALIGREDARLYDGSLTEWTADPSLPVELG
jgi:thiosulfate/3-mercaptopyruvate sulfurtransferase